MLAAASCSDKKEAPAADNQEPVNKTAKADSDTFAPTTNIRYYNMDSVMANYDLVKTFNETNLRTMTELQNAQTSREGELNRLASSIEQNMQNNGYLSEASYKADVESFNKKQAEAENYLASLQREAEQEMIQQQVQLNDSIEAFIKDYNAKKGYDAILFKNAGVYFNPALDITDEVIKGLNARYNKVSEK